MLTFAMFSFLSFLSFLWFRLRNTTVDFVVVVVVIVLLLLFVAALIQFCITLDLDSVHSYKQLSNCKYR